MKSYFLKLALLAALGWAQNAMSIECSSSTLTTLEGCSITSSRTYENSSGHGIINVYKATTSSKLTLSKPILVVSGWDPMGTMPASAVYEQLNATGLGTRLQQEGFDIVLLSFGQKTCFNIKKQLVS